MYAHINLGVGGGGLIAVVGRGFNTVHQAVSSVERMVPWRYMSFKAHTAHLLLCMVHSYLNMAHHTIVDVNFPIGNFVLY